jgi:hypothetical protein
LPKHLSSSIRQRNCLAWNRSLSWVAAAVAVFGLLVGGAVLDREQRLQLREVIQ